MGDRPSFYAPDGRTDEVAADFFRPYQPTQAYLKMGIIGEAGDGKTYTAAVVAAGLFHYINGRSLPGAKCVAFLETETGVDYIEPILRDAGCPVFPRKTRAFVDLIPAVRWCAANEAILIIDNATAFWREFCETYARIHRRTRGLEIYDWQFLKAEWWKFTDFYKDSPCHILMLGRAGYDYDFIEDEGGKKQLAKTGVKMRAEGETGYEPSLLVMMKKQFDLSDPDHPRIYRTGTVLKDRWNVIDGQTIDDPTFENFKPHIMRLNLGGAQVGISTADSSSIIVPPDETGAAAWRQKEVTLDQIEALLVSAYPGQDMASKKAKIDLLLNHCGTSSWKRIETFDVSSLKRLFNSLNLEIRREPAYYPDGTPRRLEVKATEFAQTPAGETAVQAGDRKIAAAADALKGMIPGATTAEATAAVAALAAAAPAAPALPAFATVDMLKPPPTGPIGDVGPGPIGDLPTTPPGVLKTVDTTPPPPPGPLFRPGEAAVPPATPATPAAAPVAATPPPAKKSHKKKPATAPTPPAAPPPAAADPEPVGPVGPVSDSVIEAPAAAPAPAVAAPASKPVREAAPASHPVIPEKLSYCDFYDAVVMHYGIDPKTGRPLPTIDKTKTYPSLEKVEDALGKWIERGGYTAGEEIETTAPAYLRETLEAVYAGRFNLNTGAIAPA